MKVFYHDDADGKASALLIKDAPFDKVNMEYIAINYGHTFPLDDSTS